MISSRGSELLTTTGHLMSLEAMTGTLWAGFALCTLGFLTRVYIRFICFRRLMVEDYLMLAVLGLQLAASVLSQDRLGYVYEMMDVGNGLISIPPTFVDDVPKALHGVMANFLVCIVGVWAVKFNFLIFFYRLGSHITEYMIFWWVVVIFTVGCLGTTFALTEYKCTLSSVDVIFTECVLKEDISREWRNMIITCTLDAVTDILILCFPISILRGAGVGIRKTIVLSAVFSMTLFTVAVTIIRGTIHQGRIASDNSQSQNITWLWFWLNLEFITSYIIACVGSFRMLFVKEAAKSHQPPPLPEVGCRTAINARPLRFRDSLLNTIRSLEGNMITSQDDEASIGNAVIPPKRASSCSSGDAVYIPSQHSP